MQLVRCRSSHLESTELRQESRADLYIQFIGSPFPLALFEIGARDFISSMTLMATSKKVERRGYKTNFEIY